MIRFYITGLALLLSIFIGCTNGETPSAPSQTPPVTIVNSEETGSEGKNAPEHLQKPIVIMVSIDGFRHDYLEKFQPPHLTAIANEGLKAESMIPSFPTLTFPNHITLVTGLTPGHSGIVSNKFYDETRKEFYSIGDTESINDSTWYEGDALWTIAEKSKMVSAVFFWVGSESKIGGVHPTYYKPYDGSISNSARVDQVIEWLKLPAEERPHLIALYFSDVDSAAHKNGTEADETKNATLEIDTEIGRLKDFAAQSGLPINLMVMSDHGMENLEPQKIIELSKITDISDFKMGDRGPVVNLYSDDEAAVEKAYTELKTGEKNFRVYKRSDVPASLGYSHATRVGDLVVVADIPYYIVDKQSSRMNAATHGWEPSNKNMHAFFIANGPQIQPKSVVPSFENVHVFPFVLEILGLKTEAKIDGNAEVLKPYLKN